MENTTEGSDQREVKFTYEELLVQNQSLSEELAQCRADKDFVWTLWKRLQGEKPDISSAVSMVISREQEKAEVKDQKVLVILKEKDNNIKILQEIAADLEVQLKQSMERLSALLVERTEWEGKLADLQETVHKLNEEQSYQQEVMKAREVQSKTEQSDLLSRIDGLEGQKNELETKLNSLQGEADQLNKRNSEIENAVEANAILKHKIDILEKDLELTKQEKNQQVSSLQSRETQLLAENAMVKEQMEQIEQKDAEIAALSAELKKAKDDYRECFDHVNEQHEIVRNLQLLQEETQQVLRNQQDSHKLEAKSYKTTLQELRQKCIELQCSNERLYGEGEALRKGLNSQQIKSTAKDIEIADLRESLTRRFEGYDSETQTVDQECNRCRELEGKLEDAIEEVDNMKDIIHERGRRISSLEKVLSERRKRNLALKENEMDVETEHTTDTIKERFRSKIESLEKEIEDLDALLSLKDNELQETKRAHNRRLQRYKSLRENFVMVSEQLRTFEHESTIVHHDSTRRADPKTLQHENSDSVWNELAFFRKQYQILKKEREEFEEEIDSLRVKIADKDVHMKQIELKLHEEEEECSRLREEIKSRQKFISPSKLYSAETQMELLHSKMKQLERQKEALENENQALKQRERYYKKEIADLSDEIDNVHRNIKDKIDAEVQASEMGREANKSPDSIEGRALPLVEQYIQTSPVSPFKKRSPSRELNYLSQCTQTTNSEEELSSSERLKRSPHGHGWKKLGKEKIIRKKDVLSIDDLKTLKDRKRQKVDDTGSLAGAGRVLKKRRIPPRSSPVAREHTSLKVRVLSLQQQVDVLRNAKIKLSQELQEKKSACDTIGEELESATRKLDLNRTTMRKLSEELDRVSLERAQLEKDLETERKKNKLPEIGYKELENRWKLATTESAKLSFQVKTLRGENEMLTAKQKELRERTTWLEKQLNQKKQLLEEFKEKLKENTEAIAKEKENLDESKRKNKALTLNVEQRKQYVEDLRNKMNEMAGEKLALKQKLSHCEEELKRKSRLLQQSQDLCNHAEKAVNEMEKAAFDQLHEQALQQEKVQKKLKTDMGNISKRTQEYQWIIKNFVEALLKDAHRLRVLISERRRQQREEEKKRQDEREAMKEARNLACSILNMTSEDLNSLMDEENDKSNLIETNDNDIREKLEEYLRNETKFSKHVLKLLFHIIDQNWNLKLQEYVELHQLTEMQSAS